MHMSNNRHIFNTIQKIQKPCNRKNVAGLQILNDRLLNCKLSQNQNKTYLIFKPPWINILQLFIILKTIKLNINL